MKITFRLRYDSHWGEELFLTGSLPALGLWHPEKAIALHYVAPAIWETEVDITDTKQLEYKYLIRENGQIRWEDSPNRHLPQSRHSVWDWFGKPQQHQHIGVAVPLFSLRSQESFGIGEYSDLKKLSDWCALVGIDIIQILPINDTTAWRDWRDSYPYNAISAFALNPIYLHLPGMGIEVPEDEAQLLSQQRHVDYPRVQRLKWQLLKKGFATYWEETRKRDDYQTFFKKNEDWLVSYAAFSARCDANNTIDTRRWSEHAGPGNPEFYYYLQYHCDKQLREACDYLHRRGIRLKGDIPIGVNPLGSDVYAHPELFNTDSQAGAPPDDFSADGQNWGFPTYNWDTMENDGYAWWRRRLHVMSRYFDAFRIDHILGFFRIWEIPKHLKSGMLGHFKPALPLSENDIRAYGFAFDAPKHADQGMDTLFVSDPYQKEHYHPRIALQRTDSYKALNDNQKAAINTLYDDFFYRRHNEFWKQHALQRLPAIVEATDMVACGEDLGMIPASVPEVMETLGLMSLEVQRMPKIMGRKFVQKEDLPSHCVYATGTHDMPTLRSWLEENPERTRDFLQSIGLQDQNITPDTLYNIIRNHLDSPSEWNIYPLQDLLDTDRKYWSADPNEDQINVPADPNNQWRYRMKPNMETLLTDTQLTTRLRDCFEVIP